ncbi:MAG: cell shape determination protein CcmA [Desulfobulbus propionicus]|nr:MAG: cell shape determination protein CcmA [Desulfobulbus propionicus]PIE63767.1 MAG: cell shape determination protein CcmA [Desulfobacterales bacterium]
MALFSSKNKTTAKEAPQPKRAVSSKDAISSIIAHDMKITGEIVFQGKSRIDGFLKGDLNGEYLILSETGKVDGDVRVDTLICHGKIEGNIQAKTVHVHSSASIQGKLIARSLTVEPGALLTGEICAAEKGGTVKAPEIKPAEKKIKEQPSAAATGKKQA